MIYEIKSLNKLTRFLNLQFHSIIKSNQSSSFPPAPPGTEQQSTISDRDAQSLSSQLTSDCDTMVRNMVDEFVSFKLRILKEHEDVVGDKDTMYTTRIRKMQENIDQLEGRARGRGVRGRTN